MSEAELIERGKLLLDRLCENPRFAGSAAEARAREDCRQELEGAGFTCIDRSFEFSEWPGRWGPPLSAIVQAATIIVVARMALIRDPLTALLVGAVLVGALFFVDAYAKRRWIKDFPVMRARSVNLEARRGTPRVWLVAHLDSKSQTMPMLIRIAGSVALALVMTLALVVLLLSFLGVETHAIWTALQIAGILADNIAFADRGIAAVTLSRGTLTTLARIHTRRDNSSRLSGKGAAEASALLSALAKELA